MKTYEFNMTQGQHAHTLYLAASNQAAAVHEARKIEGGGLQIALVRTLPAQALQDMRHREKLPQLSFGAARAVYRNYRGTLSITDLLLDNFCGTVEACEKMGVRVLAAESAGGVK